MSKSRQSELEPMPRYMKVSLVVFAAIFAGLVFVSGGYYLPNWKGSVVFLPIALFIGVLLIAAVVSLMFRISRRRR